MSWTDGRSEAEDREAQDAADREQEVAVAAILLVVVGWWLGSVLAGWLT